MSHTIYAQVGNTPESKVESKRSGRPKCLRVVSDKPEVDYFKPRGIPLTELEEVELKIEELEAIRLVDLNGMEQETAAKKMKVSRRTLARELKSGRTKIADALLHGKAIQLKGGYFLAHDERLFQCADDGHVWKEPADADKPDECPTCGSKKIKTKRR